MDVKYLTMSKAKSPDRKEELKSKSNYKYGRGLEGRWE